MRAAMFPLLAAAALFAAGCAERSTPPGPPPVCSCAPGDPVVDPALLAFLSKARAVHHEADLAEKAKDERSAISILERLIAGPRPGGKKTPPEVSEVIADTRARLADLRSRGGDAEGAMRDIAEGLALATTPTHFRGHLFEVKGIVLERQFEVLQAKGDAPGADRAKAAAIDAFNEAVEIQNKVIESTLPEGSPVAPGSPSADPSP